MSDDSIEFSNRDELDGFDAIVYPCDYTFKAMISVAALSEGESSIHVVKQILLEHIDAIHILSSSVKGSRTGKYESVSVLVNLQSRKELESLYQVLSNDSRVVMTL